MRYVALIDGKPGAYGVVVPDCQVALPRPQPPTRRCAAPSRRCGCGSRMRLRTARNCRSRAARKPCAAIPKLRQRSRAARRSRSCRSCATPAARPRSTCRSTRACAMRSTPPPRRAASPARRSWRAPPARRSPIRDRTSATDLELALMPRLRIYGIARTRAFRALWMANELGLDTSTCRSRSGAPIPTPRHISSLTPTVGCRRSTTTGSSCGSCSRSIFTSPRSTRSGPCIRRASRTRRIPGSGACGRRTKSSAASTSGRSMPSACRRRSAIPRRWRTPPGTSSWITKFSEHEAD